MNLTKRVSEPFSLMAKIRKTSSYIWGDELDDKIKEMDLKICTNSEFKVVQVRNFTESYIETNVKPAKADSLPQTLHKAFVAIQSYHSDPLQQSFNRKQNLILDRCHKFWNIQVNHLPAVIPH